MDGLRKAATRALVETPVRDHTDELLRVDDFAKRLNLRSKTVRNWLSLGRLSYIRLSPKSIRIPLSELNRIITEGHRPAKGAA